MASKYAQPGPWDDEPDELAWTDDKTGYACRILRNHGGALCGYVRIPEVHPLYGVEYSDALPESLRPLKDVVMDGHAGKRGAIDIFLLAMGSEFSAGNLFDVHGGVTFSGEMRNAEGHWFGFDCAHCDDLSPGYMDSSLEGVYRDLEYVKGECASLAKQLKQVAG